jgi:hypothetical protein
MNEKYKDTDLREALRRKYADTPKLPEGWNIPIPQEEPTPSPSQKEGRIKSLPYWGRFGGGSFWGRLVGAAACLLLICGVGFTLMPKDEPAKPAQMIVKQTMPKPVPKSETPSSEVRNSQFQSQKLSVPKSETKPKQVPVKPLPPIPSTVRRGVPEASPAGGGLEGAIDDPNLHYAAHAPEEETVPYQDPARVDEFIEKMAAYHNVKEGQLKCAAANDSNVVSRVYVFPDKKEVDVFGRLLQVACCYSDETPGYHLNFSHQQFFFELKDQRKQLQYRWIAERINGRILLYGTNAPIGAQTTSACYQEYRNELMHTNSIHLKTRKI